MARNGRKKGHFTVLFIFTQTIHKIEDCLHLTKLIKSLTHSIKLLPVNDTLTFTDWGVFKMT